MRFSIGGEQQFSRFMLTQALLDRNYLRTWAIVFCRIDSSEKETTVGTKDKIGKLTGHSKKSVS